MANQTTEVLVGGVVLAAAVGFFAYAAQVTGSGPAGAVSNYKASFGSVEGVTVGTDVRMSGVKVGTVTALSLNPQTFLADTSFSVDKNIRLPEDTSVLISSEGLLGGSFVELLPGGSPFELEPGAEIEDTQSSVSLITLLLRFVSGSVEGSTQ
ncbi:ABC-type transport system [Candidatus Rhodobacter oscarellae]|uniref:ABC-type transport system n=1 Tax=Candidatus Rhodobacter oscarellae TaxID=1675527 RepID=A0A0J9EF97_9RHOB|nr:outer membrane lipid asymmetry maintenance protein MlaD [Candidatus Rhodobacter lobularis]KMW60354.1 ABC-type transport system [Candidatus Rhodobacter lobularis]